METPAAGGVPGVTPVLRRVRKEPCNDSLTLVTCRPKHTKTLSGVEHPGSVHVDRQIVGNRPRFQRREVCHRQHAAAGPIMCLLDGHSLWGRRMLVIRPVPDPYMQVNMLASAACVAVLFAVQQRRAGQLAVTDVPYLRASSRAFRGSSPLGADGMTCMTTPPSAEMPPACRSSATQCKVPAVIWHAVCCINFATLGNTPRSAARETRCQAGAHPHGHTAPRWMQGCPVCQSPQTMPAQQPNQMPSNLAQHSTARRSLAPHQHNTPHRLLAGQLSRTPLQLIDGRILAIDVIPNVLWRQLCHRPQHRLWQEQYPWRP
jgi:hypothetical protein